MSTRRIHLGAVLACACLAGSGAARAGGPARPRPTPPGNVVRSWPEDVVVKGRTVRGRVDLVVDQATARVHRLAYDDDGRLVSSLDLGDAAQPRPSPGEIAEALRIVRADRELAALIGREQAVLAGGFLLRNPGGPCGPGSRCVQIQLGSRDRTRILRWVMVDLMKRAIAHRSYSHDLGR